MQAKWEVARQLAIASNAQQELSVICLQARYKLLTVQMHQLRDLGHARN